MRLLLFVFFLFPVLNLHAQFPETWLGSYSGTMYLSGSKGVFDSLQVDLVIETIETGSSWTYKMAYKSDRFGESVKDYVIRKDTSSFVMDEQNGILIEMFYSNDVFYEFFEVSEMHFASTMRKVNGSILFELFGTSVDVTKTTKTEPDEENNVFTVLSRKPQFAQIVILNPQR